MALLLTDCPRCGSRRVTFEVHAQNLIEKKHGWMNTYEVFSICRHCNKSTIFVIKLADYTLHSTLDFSNILDLNKTLNNYFNVEGFISLRDSAVHPSPEFLDSELDEAFREGATCFAVGCYNAAAAMFRLCIDLVTRQLLPDPSDTSASQPNSKQRRDLGLRMQWLLDNKILSASLQELAKCIREDGNDGAHAGNLSKEDAEDVLDFTHALLERLVTEPKKLEEAEARRKARRNPTTT